MEKQISARMSAPDDTYSRSVEALELNALAPIHEFLTEMDEVVIVAVGRKGDDINIMQINADQGVSAPPPDAPSRIRRMTIKPDQTLSQDLFSDLALAFDANAI